MKGGGLRRGIGMLFSNLSSPRWRISETRIVGKENVKMGVDRKQWNSIFKELKEETINHRSHDQQNYHLKLKAK